ncbi:ATP-binding protein [Mariprofundus sp. EBB-1]|uniref:ATP-binding protein n=1 Tax=Mariprofundus sp. EBB-1 TaxID=2650971 RepID=UPI000EF1F956|nr:ATP-binding protein [Mariprofundus sp. EBB-1]RLL55667.1 ATP-binding protein [Mariprofundus sp. EBB-1]
MSYTRLLEQRLEEALDDTPVVLIHGPRQCGKTTLAKKIGQQRGYTYLSFDDVSLVAAAKADPIGFVDRLADKVILDEVQHVPELFSSMKYAVDRKRIAGRFLLTGSANVLLLPMLSDSLAGRIDIIHLHALSRCEIENSGNGLLEQLFNGAFELGTLEKLGPDLAKYIVEGGFPEPLQRVTARRKIQWYQNYIDTLVQRDIRDLARISNLESIPKILQLAANQSAQLLNMSEIASPFQMSRQTVNSYFTLLQNIFLVDLLPAWHSNRGKRLIKTAKVHMSDTGLASALLGLSMEQLNRDRTMLGHLLESFIYNELRRQASWNDSDIKFYHYRDKDQIEVDIVMEQYGGGMVAVEVKAAATVTEKDFKGLRKLQLMVGSNWKMGVLFFDGEFPLSFGDGLMAIPISGLWNKGVNI